MSKVKIQGHASGSGVLTLTAPNTSTDRTITLPDTTGTLLDENSSVPAANLTGTVADARFPATLPAVSGANLTNLPSKGKNLIINGAMRVQQRGTASVTSGYFVDRFTLGGCSASAVLTSSTPTEFPTAISVSATSGNPIITQKIESENCQHLSGQTVIVSFYAKNISNATTLYTSLATAGGVDSWGSSTTISEQNLGSLSGSWVKYTASWTVPAGGLNGLGLNILCAGTGTFTMGVTGVQLEVGDTATDFEHRSYGEELELCKRYYQQFGHASVEQPVGAGTFNDANQVLGHFPYHTEMRAIPTTSVSSTGFLRAYAGYSGNKISTGGQPIDGITTTSARFNVDFASSTAGEGAFLQIVAGQNIYLDAEL